MMHRSLLARQESKSWALALLLIGLIGSPLLRVAAQDDSIPDQAEDPQAPMTATKTVYVIPFEQEIGKGLYLIINRAMNQAERDGADLVVLDMNTPGGAVDASYLIRDRMVDSPINSITYVNPEAISGGTIVALATDKIVMSRGSSIGAALPYSLEGDGAVSVNAKMISIVSKGMQSTAKMNGYPVDIVRGFVEPDFVIPGLKAKGEILTLDNEEATSVGLSSYTSATLEELLAKEGFADARRIDFKKSNMDMIALFLTLPVVQSLLMLLGMGGLFFEVKSPGFGVPGAIGLGSLFLFFFGAYSANLSGYVEIIFFIVGVILLIVEVFVTPGFGVFGISGLICVIGSLFFALFRLPPSGIAFSSDQLVGPLLTMVATMLASVPAVWLAMKALPHTPLYSAMVLQPPPVSPSQLSLAQETGDRKSIIVVGARGIAQSDLRPSGVALFDGHLRTDVVTDGEYVSKGDDVIIRQVVGNRVVVQKA